MKPHDVATHALSRRGLILGSAALLAGCTRIGGGQAGRPTKTGSAEPTPPPTPALYRAPAGDALPAFKEAAGRFAQGLATYDPSDSTPLPTPPGEYLGVAEELASAAAPLVMSDHWSRADVEFVQYGGLTPVSAQATSGVALIVLRQVLQNRRGDALVVRRTLDVRLRQRGGIWRVEALASAGGTELERPAQLAVPAQQVLDDSRIDLTDSARWDIYSGQISPNLLRVMLRLADVTPLRTTVLKTGHPERVVDGRTSPPVSAHWRGQAVDIHSLGGVPIADAAASVIRSVVETAGADKDVSQVGAPPGFDLDAGGRRGFTNLVHADHLHIAVRRTT
ncbi:MAG: hypothetical protein EPN99_09050 [Frankiales bacterium]|nr:MAG: hypothetical protein EPN99_09050 [Frankiales bacterium]